MQSNLSAWTGKRSLYRKNGKRHVYKGRQIGNKKPVWVFFAELTSAIQLDVITAHPDAAKEDENGALWDAELPEDNPLDDPADGTTTRKKAGRPRKRGRGGRPQLAPGGRLTRKKGNQRQLQFRLAIYCSSHKLL